MRCNARCAYPPSCVLRKPSTLSEHAATAHPFFCLTGAAQRPLLTCSFTLARPHLTR
jgi:hypothetical protein